MYDFIFVYCRGSRYHSMDTDDQAVQTDANNTPVLTAAKSVNGADNISPQQQEIKAYLNSRGLNVDEKIAEACGSSSR